MRRPSPLLRTAAAVLLVAWSAAPGPGFAAEDEGDEAKPPPAPIERHWYDEVMRQTDIGVDLLVVRPCALLTFVAGAMLFVPASLMTAPNGWDSEKEAWQRFVIEPGEYFYSRPLGEF
jgi:hypothetical protein